MDINPVLGSGRRKSAKREPWKRVKQRKFQIWKLDEPEFTGYLTRLDLLEVFPPLVVHTPDGLELCVADTGYTWTQHFPTGTHYTLTTQFDAEGKFVQWYADVCLEHGLDEVGIPWYADLYLDVVSLPGGGFAIIDGDELEAALEAGEVSREHYDLAWREATTLLGQMRRGELGLLDVSLEHYRHYSSG